VAERPHLGRNVSGYSSFYFDVTPYANPGGTNVLVVRVDASRFEGWFYEGAGIYRHVWLTTENPVHVAQWGTFVAIPRRCRVPTPPSPSRPM
jgi:beta-galactosidase